MTCRNLILTILFFMMTGKGACIHPFKIFKFIDIGECFQRRIELPELLDRYVAGVDATDHLAKGIGFVILKVL